MRPHLTFLATATLVLVAVSLAEPRTARLAFALYAVALGTQLVAFAARRVARHEAVPSRFEGLLRERRSGAAAPSELTRLERRLALATGSADGVDMHLRPYVRDLAALLLRARGIELEREPERARRLLGDESWELVRPDRMRLLPHDRRGRSLDELSTLVDELEQGLA